MTSKVFKSGSLFGIGLAIVTLIASVILWYIQTSYLYEPVSGVTQIMVQGQPIMVTEYQGVESSSRPLKMRACFRVANVQEIRDIAPVLKNVTPFRAHSDFTCWNAETLAAKLQNNTATALLAEELELEFYCLLYTSDAADE